MNFPSPHEINSLNYLLMVIASLDKYNRACSIKRVKRVCSLRVYNGILVDYSIIIEFGRKVKLLSYDKKGIKLTKTGFDFLDLNKKLTFQISEQQKFFFSEHCIFNGPWRTSVRNFFLLFNPNHDLVTYEFSKFDNFLPIRHNAVCHTLKDMNVIQELDNMIRVTPPFVPHVKRIRAENKSLSESELKAILEADEKLASLAEDRVVEYEQKRLINLGRYIEATAVKRISTLDVLAGYDIKSFNGNNPEVEPSRFIEVKASRQSKVRFYWSTNEYRAAKELGENYWIYFIGGFSDTTIDVEPIMIQNPANRIGEIKELKMGVYKYIVTQEDALPLMPIDKEIKGFIL